MTERQVYIGGAGIVSPLGVGLGATEKALLENRSAIKPLELFPLMQGSPLPVGEADRVEESSALPRTHMLALTAAQQAMEGYNHPPDAIVIGTTTGGILTTEELLRSNEQKKELYRNHGLNTVVSFLARELNCKGPALTVSTACSSGAVAISMALKMLRRGEVEAVLAGGVDSLCRLTYFGFHSLQLVDNSGCKPLDRNRRGMVVAEGAGLLLLTTVKPQNPYGVLLGAGLSCDAYHPAAPHPEGKGAFSAMQNALADGGLSPDDISYINLHGTGTPDNDLAESRALHKLFINLPPLSSIKGASGHSLAAAGGIEAVVSTIILSRGLMPANTGLQEIDPELDLTPLTDPLESPVRAVLSNSFGFGGNNGSLVIGKADIFSGPVEVPRRRGLAIHEYSCLTGAGATAASITRMHGGGSVAGRAELDMISKNLPPRLIRRLKRLPRITLSLAAGARGNPDSVFMGTGWGALSETCDFLTRLKDSKEQFPSPTDFVGSVHNGPASQVAIMFGATGPNITTSGGDYSFEQALFAAELMHDESAGPAVIIGADEGHDIFSPLFDPSIEQGSTLADGGAAFCVNRKTGGADCSISIPYYESSRADGAVAALVDSLGGVSFLQNSCALILAGIPAASRREGELQLEQFMAQTKLSAPVIHYRRLTGEFASASAVAAALAVSFFETGTVPRGITGRSEIVIDSRMNKILVLGFGSYITAMEFSRL